MFTLVIISITAPNSKFLQTLPAFNNYNPPKLGNITGPMDLDEVTTLPRADSLLFEDNEQHFS